MYPIIIPVKKKSVRLDNKNHILIDYTLNYAQSYGKENIFILTDDEYIIDKYGKEYNIIFDDNNKKDILYSLNSATEKCGFKYVHLLCVTNPFREKNVLLKMETKMMNNNDASFITTKVQIPNRKIFLLDENDKFKYTSKKGRKGKYVKRTYMIDGSAYLINCDFLKNICEQKKPNKSFWESDFKTVVNNVPFMDIDIKEDLDDFNFICNYGLNKKEE